ncbi:MAG: calcium/sodium antiporter [Planctomycetota bacterium]|nr:calcium/sodium antiporter [Planctomycetota bacterium]MDA0920793.1 calcium/sodium antiporter [Planctomycetota bacterium]MDA1161149.1 calcium/sodium antiporter [Planctomycetota bacterium]
MDKLLEEFLNEYSTVTLLGVIAVSLVALGKFADLVVDYAVVLSERSGIPKVVIGATVVSLGTTAPEVAVSVTAAFNGNPGLAMGNAVGSIICDTGLILGVACLIRPLTIPWEIANRQGWVQLACGFLIVLLSTPWAAPFSPYTDGAEGNFPQWAGFLCLSLLAVYLWVSVKWSMGSGSAASDGDEAAASEGGEEEDSETSAPAAVLIVKIILSLVGVILSANILIPAVTIVAGRMNVPESIIAATLVAFGTSLPELVTAIQAARKGHGDLAVGNIIGADILNALFVAGAAAAVTPAGLTVDQSFFWPAFPAMLFVLVVFRIGIYVCRTQLTRNFGFVLLAAYFAYLGVSIAAGVNPGH